MAGASGHRAQADASAPRMASLMPVAVVTAAHVAVMSALAWTWLAVSGAPRGWTEALVCTAPIALALGLGLTSQADRNQYTVRLVACAAMLPILLLMWAGSQDPLAEAPATTLLARRPWIFFVGVALLDIAAFVGAIVWLAGTVTRVEPAAGTARVPAATLVQRVRSLAAAGAPFDVAAGDAPGHWAVTLRLGEPGRTHRVLLHVDERTGTVRVRERLSASGAAPRDADEASMRGIGKTTIDPTRPDAQRVSGRMAQASMIDPARLRAMRLVLRDGRAEPPPQALATTDADELVTLLCALVTRSGYAWQPTLVAGS